MLPFRGENDKALGAAICQQRLRFPRATAGDDDVDAPAAATASLSAFCAIAYSS